jgi:hypothetical protein
MKCEYCKKVKKLVCFFYYRYVNNKLIINVDNGEEWDWEYTGDIETYSSYNNLEEFKSDFPWYKQKIYSYDDDNEEEPSFCFDCFEKLIFKKKIRYKNNGRQLSTPLYTNCCEKYYAKGKGLICLSRINIFPYQHYWKDIKWNYGQIEAIYHGIDEFDFIRKDDDLMVCKKCLVLYKDWKVSYTNMNKYREDYDIFYEIRRKKKIDVSYIDKNWKKPPEYIKKLRKLLLIRDEIKIFFLKRAEYRKCMIYLNCLSRNFPLHKDVKKLIAKMCID